MERKKLAMLIIAFMMSVSMCACGNSASDTSVPSVEENDTTTEALNENIELNVYPIGIMSDTISIPDYCDSLMEKGYSSVEYVGEGCFKGVLEQSVLAKLLEEQKAYVEELITEFDSGEIKGVVSIEADDDRMSYTIYANDGETDIVFGLKVYALATATASYHVYSGLEYGDFEVTVRAIDKSSGDEIVSYTLSEMIDGKKQATYVEESLKGEESATAESEKIETQSITDGEVITIDGLCEFSIDGWEYDDEIRNPSVATKMLTGSGEDTKVVWLNMNYKNLSSEEANAYQLSSYVELSYKNEYTYEGGTGAFDDLVSLSTQKVYIYARVPVSVIEDTEEEKVMIFEIGGKRYSYMLN